MRFDAKPMAVGSLSLVERNKRGLRTVAAVNPQTGRISILDDLEYSVLMLCDGDLAAEEIAATLERSILSVREAMEYLDEEALLESDGAHAGRPRPQAGALAAMQAAYDEFRPVDLPEDSPFAAGPVEPSADGSPDTIDTSSEEDDDDFGGDPTELVDELGEPEPTERGAAAEARTVVSDRQDSNHLVDAVVAALADKLGESPERIAERLKASDPEVRAALAELDGILGLGDA